MKKIFIAKVMTAIWVWSFITCWYIDCMNKVSDSLFAISAWVIFYLYLSPIFNMFEEE